jgi:catalase
MCYVNQGNTPNYFPNSASDGLTVDPSAAQSVFPLSGDVQRHDSGAEDNFFQVNNFWTDVLDAPARQRLVNNIAGSLKNANPTIQARTVANFTQVNPEFGTMLTEALEAAQGTRRGSQRQKRRKV